MDRYEINRLLKQIAELQQEINATKKYGLVWDKEHTREKVIIDCENKIPLIINDYAKQITCDNSENNILIEGDNFCSLASLSFSMKESIDVIYIDPPYNTGHDDFCYNDKFVETEDGYRHSKWLNFMFHRLSLAKGLLKKDGLMFISIDDREFAQLKLLCDSIFSERNFIGCFNWMKTATAPNLSKNN